MQEIEFVSGDSEESVVVSIVDDDVPELDEVFCVSLILPEGGAVLGDIPEGIRKYVHPFIHSLFL